MAQKPENAAITGSELSVMIVYYYDGATDLDLDNIAKPVLDAMVGAVYVDDSQVSQLLLRKSPLLKLAVLNDAEPSLLDAIDQGENFVYVRIGDAPNHGVMPQW